MPPVDLISGALWPLLLSLLGGTIPLAAASFVAGIAIALIVARLRISPHRAGRAIAGGFVSVIRGTPLLIQLFIIFYGFPALGVVLDPWPSAIIAFSLNVGGYAAETIRAALLSVPPGQWEAAAMVGLTRNQTLNRIILPQALRVAVPPLSNTLISLVKDTSLASAVLVTEITRKAQELAAPSFDFFALYAVAAAYYWVVCQLLAHLQVRVERRLGLLGAQ